MNPLPPTMSVVAMTLLAACGGASPSGVQFPESGTRHFQQATVTSLPSTVGVPAGTELTLALDRKLSSETSRAGDPFLATVVAPIVVNGRDVIPAGSTIEGKVADAAPAGSGTRRATLALSFHALRLTSGYQIDVAGSFRDLSRPLGEGREASTEAARRDAIIPAATPFGITLERPLQIPRAATGT